MTFLFRCCALAAALLLSACLTKMIDKDYSPPVETALAQLRFLPVVRGGYTVEIQRGERWLRLQGQVGERRKLAGIGDADFFNEFGMLKTEIAAGSVVTMALTHFGGAAGAPPCRVELKLCASVAEHYEVVTSADGAGCTAYVQQEVISDGGVLRRQKLSPDEAASCEAPPES